MILWSKGLGKLVLRMKLAERSSARRRDGKFIIDGTMGPPTHWDYAVTMDENDVLDFVELLKQPAPVDFLVEGKAPGAVVRTAIASGFVFAWNTTRCFLGMVPRDSEHPQAPTAEPRAASAKRSR
jgi:hypothetical protein